MKEVFLLTGIRRLYHSTIAIAHFHKVYQRVSSWLLDIAYPTTTATINSPSLHHSSPCHIPRSKRKIKKKETPTLSFNFQPPANTIEQKKKPSIQESASFFFVIPRLAPPIHMHAQSPAHSGIYFDAVYVRAPRFLFDRAYCGSFPSSAHIDRAGWLLALSLSLSLASLAVIVLGCWSVGSSVYVYVYGDILLRLEAPL